ncbi:MAG: glycoside hydrolase family 28 protein [Pedobacter sp.]|nr:glycoside hydrolase family 28 protein [Chitinophagaceae bacterium]
MKRILLLLSVFVTLNINAQNYYNVIEYGAKNDSSKLATTAIVKAIDAASKVGGGTIYFPAGKYLTGSIHLKSNITILIDAGAELHFSNNFDDYLPMVESRYEGVDVFSFSPLFYAYKVENIAIKGRGIINGHGQKWWAAAESKNLSQGRNKWQLLSDSLNKNILLPDDAGQTKKGFLRPPLFQPMYCNNVLVEGITIINSPFWTITPEFCENVTIHAVTINNPLSPNTDGINPSSCRYVHISDCHISVGDDCITIKSGKDLPGRTKATPAENYTITNCTMLSGHGGVVIGSEMSGDVKKIVISNCVFDGTDRGIRIKTARGRGGVVEDVRISNIVMKNIKENAFVLDMQYSKTKPEPVTERTPRFRNIHYSNITVVNAKNAGFINGLEEMPIENITFTDIDVDAENGFTIQNAKGIAFHNVQVNATKGFAFKIMDASNIELDNVKSTKPLPAVPVISINNVIDAFIHNCWPAKNTDTFIQVKGTQTKNIIIKYNNFNNTSKPLAKEDDVKENIIVE